MGFIAILPIILPALIAAAIILYSITVSLGFCLLAMGFSGLIMNKISESQTEPIAKPVKDLNILLSFTFGVVLILISLRLLMVVL
ncbi:MAG: hypothetical protein FWG90_03525 [Oscillospiraceae bacterium]|nr:hypothetical protein [Oscillospiraceae bacterium]